MQTIKLDYMRLPSEDDALKIILLEPADERAIKTRTLAKMEVFPLAHETPLDAWLKHLHKINNLPYTKPANPAISDAILESQPARLFLWWLA